MMLWMAELHVELLKERKEYDDDDNNIQCKQNENTVIIELLAVIVLNLFYVCSHLFLCLSFETFNQSVEPWTR